MGVLQDLLAGNFSGVVHDITAGFSQLPAPVQTFVVKVESDAEGLLGNLCSVAIKDVETAGFTTASFVAAGKDVVAQGLSQGTAILISDAMAMLNMFASTMQASAVAEVPVVEHPAEIIESPVA